MGKKRDRFDKKDIEAVEATTALLNAIEMSDYDAFNTLWDTMTKFERGRAMYMVSQILLDVIRGIGMEKGKLQTLMREVFEE